MQLCIDHVRARRGLVTIFLTSSLRASYPITGFAGARPSSSQPLSLPYWRQRGLAAVAHDPRQRSTPPINHRRETAPRSARSDEAESLTEAKAADAGARRRRELGGMHRQLAAAAP